MNPNQSKVDRSGISPFWKELGVFLAAPLHKGPIMLLALVALGGVVAGLIGGFALALRGVVIFAAVRFAFQLFDHFSTGRFNVDSPEIVAWPQSDPRASKQGVIILFYLALLVGLAFLTLPNPAVLEPSVGEPEATFDGGEAALPSGLPDVATEDETSASTPEADEEAYPPFEAEADAVGESAAASGYETAPIESLLPRWFWLVAALFAVPIPAASAVLALEGRLIKSLDPKHTLTFIRAMGGGYLILLGLFLAIFLVRFGIAAFARDLPPALHYSIEGVAIAYLTIVLYAMLGYVVYQYHDEFGLMVDVDFETHKAAALAPEVLSPLERKIRPLLAEGDFDKAIEWVKDEMRYDRLDLPLNRRLHELYELKGDKALTLAHGQQYLRALVREKKDDEALKLLLKMEGVDAAFVPENGDTIFPLAESAYKARRFEKALSLLNGFDRRHPGHPRIPDVYLLGAKLSSEFLRKDLHAMAIVKTLLKRYPEAECAEEAGNYLRALENIAGLAKPT